MDKLTAIKIKYDDGTYSDEIPISVLSKNVEWDNTHTLVDILGSIDVDATGTIQDQISQLFNEKVSITQLNNYVASQLNTDVTNWLNNNVDPAGSAVVVDSSLTIQGAAADAKVVGDLKSALLPYNAFDVISLIFSPENKTMNQVTFSWNGKVCTVSGTSDAIAVCNIIPFKSSLPTGIVAGETYQFIYKTTNTNIQLGFIFFDSNDVETYSNKTESGNITIPSGTVKMSVRLYIKANKNASGTVSAVAILSEKTNADDDIVNQIVENNAYDIIAAENLKQNTVYNGINYTWIDENTCQISGTSTAISINNLLSTTLTTMTLPKGIEPGKKLRFIVDMDGTYTEKTCASVVFGDSEGNLIDSGVYTQRTLEFTVPTNAVRAFIRIFISAGETVNATMKMRLFTTLTNAELQDSLLTRLSFEDTKFSPAEGATLSLDDAPVNEIVMLTGNGYTECPLPSGSQYGYLMTFYKKKGINHKFQILITSLFARQYLRTYAIGTNTWNPWNTIIDSNNGGFVKNQMISADEDFDTFKISGYYNVSSTANGHNKPNIGYGILFVYAISNNYVIQFAANYSNTVLFERTCNGGTWGEWKNIRNVPQINNSYTYNTVTNNITNTPTITTDTHNFLASTNDTTDRTADIVSMIATGYCKLGPGVFYISEVDIPALATLEGCGNATQVILKSEGTYAFRLKTKSVIRNLRILGSTSDISVSDTVANRHGIVWYGKASETPASEIPYGAIISNVLIRSFTGGGITCHDTGGSPQASLNVTDVQIENCNAGVNIDYRSEFNSFSNVRMNACYYGCINNGGNNNFTNCRFDGNAMGLLMDNSSGTMRNNSHGSIVGCSFNHNNPGNAYDLVNFGYAIKMYGMESGEVFSGCQIFYGKILLDNSKGVIFNACNFGIRTQLQIVSNSTAMFANNFIQALQSVDKDGTVTVISNGNYLRDGTEVTI